MRARMLPGCKHCGVLRLRASVKGHRDHAIAVQQNAAAQTGNAVASHPSPKCRSHVRGRSQNDVASGGERASALTRTSKTYGETADCARPGPRELDGDYKSVAAPTASTAPCPTTARGAGDV